MLEGLHVLFGVSARRKRPPQGAAAVQDPLSHDFIAAPAISHPGVVQNKATSRWQPLWEGGSPPAQPRNIHVAAAGNETQRAWARNSQLILLQLQGGGGGKRGGHRQHPTAPLADALCPSPGMGQQNEPAFAPSLSPSSPLMSPQLPPSQSPMLQPAPPTPGYQSPDMKSWQQGAMGNSK